MNPLSPLRWNDAKHALCGFAMGAADIVPGVSGGTVALVLGVYERLLTAISRVDTRFVARVARSHFREAAEQIDLRFLLSLGVGIGLAIVSLARLMHYLLENHLAPTYAAFFGLILASGLLVGRMCRPASRGEAGACVALGLIAAAAAFGLVSQDHLQAQPGLGYTFFSGAIAICAMILPGVSGSYLLLMLGKYHEITGIIKDLPRLAVGGGDVATLAVFAAGCLCGLLLFSRLLKWLLARHAAPTVAALCGMMIGSLYKIWPLQRDTTPSVEEFKEKVFEPYWPASFDGQALTCATIALAAFFGVIIFDALGRRAKAARQAGG